MCIFSSCEGLPPSRNRFTCTLFVREMARFVREKAVFGCEKARVDRKKAVFG
jgi:hypothetical protein